MKKSFARLVSPVVECRERSWLTRDGLTLRGKTWGGGDGAATRLPIFAIHGWLDNAASFDYLAPRLAERLGTTCTAVDMIGQGRSDHRPRSAAATTAFDYTRYMMDVLDLEKVEQCVLVGHSMGGVIASVLAGTFTERVALTVLLESIGMVTKDASEAPANLRSAIAAHNTLNAKPPREFADLDSAVDQRVQAVANHPGNQLISREAARAIVARGTTAAPGGRGGVVFSHDMLLYAPLQQRATREINESFLSSIECPVLYISAEDGWPLSSLTASEDGVERRLALVGDVTHRHMEGSHHLHADPHTAPAVTEVVHDWLAARLQQQSRL